ncbi:nitroreductase family protein [Microbacterium sp. bgisy203]|uniref:nitroreductase family protein n=1 Tax=Microbacterium sp. bgisy203 TaxID=3413799 RepID=UPI003D73E00E
MSADASHPALDAVRARRSWSKVTDAAPTRAELLTLVSDAGRVADHSSLRPWRIIELRGDDRRVLGAAIAEAQGDDKPSTKPLRAPLLVAIVASYKPSEKVPRWEQEAVASGVAHTLSLLLDEAGWGVIWRTGHYTRTEPVARAHGLAANEELLGWLYVGGKPERDRPSRRKAVDAPSHVSRMPGITASPDEFAHWRQKPAATSAKKQKKKSAKGDKKPTDWAAKADKAERKAKKAARKASKAAAKALKARAKADAQTAQAQDEG